MRGRDRSRGDVVSMIFSVTEQQQMAAIAQADAAKRKSGRDRDGQVMVSGDTEAVALRQLVNAC